MDTIEMKTAPRIRVDRRRFLNQFGLGLGGLALAELMNGKPARASEHGVLGQLHHTPKAKRVIFLFQAGGPSQIDLFDHKPVLNQLHGEQLPASVRHGQRLTGMSGNQSSLPLAGSPFKFRQHGQSGAWLSELLPRTALVADDLCFIKSMHTDAINHGPGVTFMQTGSQFPGRPSIGSWLTYGMGSESEDLPAFVVMVTKNKGGQPLVARLWGNGFLPTRHQGVRFRSGKDPVLYLSNPAGIDATSRAATLASLKQLYSVPTRGGVTEVIESRIARYEMAYRMQTSIPEATNLAEEPEHVFREYGEDARSPGTYAANCLLARRLAERGVRFIQLYHQGWDQHGGLPKAITRQCHETDRASAALVADLKRRGLLDDTLVIWSGEFGRTDYCQGKLTDKDFGRDHHGRCFTLWMAGGGSKPGVSLGETDPLGYNITRDPVDVHDFHATLLYLMGIDHLRLTFKHQGRRFRLTDVGGKVIHEAIA